MNASTLTPAQRQTRQNIRNFFLTATRQELSLVIYNYPDQFSRDCIQELIDECD